MNELALELAYADLYEIYAEDRNWRSNETLVSLALFWELYLLEPYHSRISIPDYGY
jgi:hypothetical protein